MSIKKAASTRSSRASSISTASSTARCDQAETSSFLGDASMGPVYVIGDKTHVHGFEFPGCFESMKSYHMPHLSLDPARSTSQTKLPNGKLQVTVNVPEGGQRGMTPYVLIFPNDAASRPVSQPPRQAGRTPSMGSTGQRITAKREDSFARQRQCYREELQKCRRSLNDCTLRLNREKASLREGTNVLRTKQAAWGAEFESQYKVYERREKRMCEDEKRVKHLSRLRQRSERKIAKEKLDASEREYYEAIDALNKIETSNKALESAEKKKLEQLDVTVKSLEDARGTLLAKCASIEAKIAAL